MDVMWNTNDLEQKLMLKAAAMRQPIYGVVELLPLCNMNCDMCYVRLSRQEMEKKGRLRTVDEWLELAQQMRDAGTLVLLLTGGEPLLYPDFKRLYTELLSMGMIVLINTNGTLIDEEWASFFGMHKPRQISITLYGANENVYANLCHYPGGYEKVLRGVRLLKAQGVEVKLSGTAVRANYEDRFEILRIAKELSVPAQTDSYVYPATRERDKPYNKQARFDPVTAARVRVEMMKAEHTPEQFKANALGVLYRATHTPPGEDKPGEMKCHAGRSMFVINWQGQMRPCVMLSEPSVPVFEQGFAQSWRMIVEGVDQIRLSSKCSQCTLRNVCNTCAACALHESGSYDGVPEYACRYTVETLNCLAAEMKALTEQQRKENEE